MTVNPKAPAAQNGNAALHDDFPVDSFRDAARHLRRPFTAAAVKFKVQAVWPKDDPTGGLIVAYIDARLAVERLNLVLPHLWRDAYRPVGNGQMWCDLTIDEITRSDVGEGTGKGLVSDALKRAAVKFGIGVSLYAIPKMILNASDGTLKQKKTKDGLTLELTPRGEALLRTMYAAWLDQHGRQAFGEPLDHGDVEDHQGDPAETPPGVDAETGEVTQPEHEAEREVLDDERAEGLDKLAREIVEAEVWSRRKLGTALRAAGATDMSSVGVAIRTLTPEAADELASTIDALLSARAEAAA